MRRLFPLYPFVLSLLVGGNVLYTFLATPVIFARFERDLAGRVVAAMMPWYFGYDVALVVIAAAVFTVAAGARNGRTFKASAVLLGLAAVIVVAVAFWVYPAMLEVRSQVASFAVDAPMTAAREAFRRLHAASSALNLLLLAAGSALLLLSPRHAPPAE